MPYATQGEQSAYANRRYWSDPLAQVKHNEVTRATKGLPPRQLYLAVSLHPATAELETMVERVPAKNASAWFYGWKELRRDGWDVSVLVSPDRLSLIGLACRNGERWRFV